MPQSIVQTNSNCIENMKSTSNLSPQWVSTNALDKISPYLESRKISKKFFIRDLYREVDLWDDLDAVLWETGDIQKKF